MLIDIGSGEMTRESLCSLQTFADEQDAKVLQRLIDAIDAQRPLGADGKHGELHTDTCGCEGHEGLRSAPVASESHIVALNPVTTSILYHAWYCEMSRIRHQEEFWFGQAERDQNNRDMWRERAIQQGVPVEQCDAYIYSGEWNIP